MVDMHCHVLPGVDDGARTTEEALEMMRMAAENGTEVLVATPHVIEGEWLPEWPAIVDACERLQVAARQEGITSIRLCPGAELAMNWDMLPKLDGSGAYCLNGGRYLLVELPATHVPDYADRFFFTLQARGIIPVIAHPERNQELISKPDILRQWCNQGMCVQLNGPSLLGRFGKKVKEMADLLVDNGLVHCIGSDGHGLRTRTPALQEAVVELRKRLGPGQADELLLHNPERILASQSIVGEEIGVLRYRKVGFWQRVFGRFW